MWFLLALTAALAQAFGDAATRKILSHGYWSFGALSAQNLLIAFFHYLGGAVVIGALLAMQDNPPAIQAGFWTILALLMLAEFAAAILRTSALAMEEYSAIDPLLTVNPVFMVLLAYFWLGESVTSWGMLGIVAVIAGSFWFTLTKRARRAKLLALVLVFLVALLWTFTSVAQKAAIQKSSILLLGTIHLLGMTAISSIFLMASLWHGKQRRALRSMLASKSLLGLVMVSAAIEFLSQYIGITLVQVGYFFAVKRIKPFFSLLLGRYWLKEADALKRVWPVALMIAGVAGILLWG